jgi:protein dpy-30
VNERTEVRESSAESTPSQFIPTESRSTPAAPTTLIRLINPAHDMSMEPVTNPPVAAEPEKPANSPTDPPAPAAPAAPAAPKPKEELTDDDLKALPLRQYLEHTVVGVIMQGMQQISRKRPDDPVSFLADFLLRNNPRKRKADDAGVGGDAKADDANKAEAPKTEAAAAATPAE